MGWTIKVAWSRNALGLAVLLLGWGLSVTPVHAEIRYALTPPDGQPVITLTHINQKREANGLVLYTHDYGKSTRTNPFGTEVAAEPAADGDPTHYEVTQVMTLSECQQAGRVSACGNLAIPANGIVLSANGRATTLLAHFQPGTAFTLASMVIYESRHKLSVVDPTPQNNPAGSGFPGFRAGNQLILYDTAYGQPTTGTNEFGYEVTVQNERVVEAEGANSKIPAAGSTDSFVLSGHGAARLWLLQNAPIGSRIQREGDVIVSTVDKDTYLYQLDQMVQKIQRHKFDAIAPDLQHQLDELKTGAFNMSNQEVAENALALQEKLTPVLWASYNPVDKSAMRAAWLRPSETSVAEIRQTLDLIQHAGLNTIFLETYLHGNPIFPSRTFAKYHIPQSLPFTVKDCPDVLATWLTEAHRRGLKVHVWFQTFYAGNRQYDASIGDILKIYPAWANIQHSALTATSLQPSSLEPGAYFLDPANPEVHQFLLDLIDEIVTRYPVDGFQLDYIRYPGAFPPDRFSYLATTWGYTPIARQLFQAQSGQDPNTITPKDNPDAWEQWNRFKQEQVDGFVSQAHDLIKREKPTLPISAAVFPKLTESIARKHQNWQGWTQQGWVDFLAPMTLTSAMETIAEDTKGVEDASHLPVITGIFGPFNGNDASDVVEQVWTAFTAGAQGVILFDAAHLTARMADALHAGLFHFPPTAPPAAATPGRSRYNRTVDRRR